MNRETRILVAPLLGWLVPGLGHAFLGRRGRALFLGGIVLALYLAGLALGDWRVVSLAHEPLWFVGEACALGPTLIVSAITSHLPWDRVAAHYHVALLYVTVAGLLNVVVAVDALGLALADARGTRA